MNDELYEQKVSLMEKIIRNESPKGQFFKNLTLFAVSDEWSLYPQQHLNGKLPIISTEYALYALAWTRLYTQMCLWSGGANDDYEMYIKVFQLILVHEQIQYQQQFPDKHDYQKIWTSANLSWKNIERDPLFYHDKWVSFFTVKKANIDQMVEYIMYTLDVRMERINIDREIYKNKNINIKEPLTEERFQERVYETIINTGMCEKYIGMFDAQYMKNILEKSIQNKIFKPIENKQCSQKNNNIQMEIN